MAVYTSFDMMSDCRANKREGWSFFVTQYLPVCRALLAHYFADRAADTALLGRVATATCRPESGLFADRGLALEREFVGDLRQHVLAAVEADRASEAAVAPLDLEILTKALEAFTPLERQAAWLMTMRYDAAETARILRMEPKTVEAVRERAIDAVRHHVDNRSRDILETNGVALGRDTAAGKTDSCLPARAFLDLLDGKMTWRRRQDMEFHLNTCWHCVDHLCRLREVDELLRFNKPLTPEDAAPFLALLGVPAEEKKPLWKRMFS